MELPQGQTGSVGTSVASAEQVLYNTHIPEFRNTDKLMSDMYSNGFIFVFVTIGRALSETGQTQRSGLRRAGCVYVCV